MPVNTTVRTLKDFRRKGTRSFSIFPFYGLSLPLKHGIPVRPLQLDNVRRYPGYLAPYRVLVLSYEFIKPEYPDIHNALAQWVQDGGALIYVGDDSDPYHGIRSWWNNDRKDEPFGSKYNSPREHLFERLGLKGKRKASIRQEKASCAGWISIRLNSPYPKRGRPVAARRPSHAGSTSRRRTTVESQTLFQTQARPLSDRFGSGGIDLR